MFAKLFARRRTPTPLSLSLDNLVDRVKRHGTLETNIKTYCGGEIQTTTQTYTLSVPGCTVVLEERHYSEASISHTNRHETVRMNSLTVRTPVHVVLEARKLMSYSLEESGGFETPITERRNADRDWTVTRDVRTLLETVGSEIDRQYQNSDIISCAGAQYSHTTNTRR